MADDQYVNNSSDLINAATARAEIRREIARVDDAIGKLRELTDGAPRGHVCLAAVPVALRSFVRYRARLEVIRYNGAKP